MRVGPRMTACFFFENRALEFPDFLHEAWKCRFQVFANIPKMTNFGKKWPKSGLNLAKMTKKEAFLHFFFREPQIRISYFLLEALSLERKIISFSLFCGNIKNGPFWPKFFWNFANFTPFWVWKGEKMPKNNKNSTFLPLRPQKWPKHKKCENSKITFLEHH